MNIVERLRIAVMTLENLTETLDGGVFLIKEIAAHSIASDADVAADTIEALAEALKAMISLAQENICSHKETHRGGFLWTVCDACGAAWADDEGGKPEWEEPSEFVLARAALRRVEES